MPITNCLSNKHTVLRGYILRAVHYTDTAKLGNARLVVDSELAKRNIEETILNYTIS